MPFWFLLLETYQGGGGFGLTPSFLLGAARYVEGEAPEEPATRDDLEELLRSMAGVAASDRSVRVSRCPGLGLPVIRIVDSGSAGVPVVDSSGQPMRLSVLPNVLSTTQPTTADLTVALWEEFGDAISNGRFSRSDGEFRVFGPADFALIHAATGG